MKTTPIQGMMVIVLLVILSLTGPKTSLAAGQAKTAADILSQLTRTDTNNLRVLKGLEAKVPEAAKPAIQAAIKDTEGRLENLRAVLKRRGIQEDAVAKQQALAQALEQGQRAQQMQSEILKAVLNQVPDSTKPAIQRAIAVSDKGMARARASFAEAQAGRPTNNVVGRSGGGVGGVARNNKFGMGQMSVGAIPLANGAVGSQVGAAVRGLQRQIGAAGGAGGVPPGTLGARLGGRK